MVMYSIPVTKTISVTEDKIAYTPVTSSCVPWLETTHVAYSY